jgi:hypothetical protein
MRRALLPPPDSADARVVGQSFPHRLLHLRKRTTRLSAVRVISQETSPHRANMSALSRPVLGLLSRRAVTPHNCEPRFAGERNRRWPSPPCHGGKRWQLVCLLAAGKGIYSASREGQLPNRPRVDLRAQSGGWLRPRACPFQRESRCQERLSLLFLGGGLSRKEKTTTPVARCVAARVA